MLRFTRMEIDNFGPYKGEQLLDFTRRKGVTIFWGNNGAGKTTLLNAFRYVLFGMVHKRSGQPLRNLRDLVNREGYESGKYGFSIVLHMENDGDVYDLIRRFQPRKGVRIPETDDDYEQSMLLKKNGGVLSQEQSKHELSMIMPEQISRFFLFDGELLQEYEELVQDENVTGEGIKNAIEKILGLPILSNAYMDLESCLKAVEHNRNRAAQQNSKNQQASSQLQCLQEGITEHKKNVDEMQSLLHDLRAKKRNNEGKLTQTQYIRALLEQVEMYKGTITSLEEKIEIIKSKYQESMTTAWKGMLHGVVSKLSKSIDQRIKELEQKQFAKGLSDHFIGELKQSIEDKKCLICGHELSADELKYLENRLKAGQSEFAGLTEEEKAQLDMLRNSSSDVRSLVVIDQSAYIKSYEEQLDELQIELDTARQEKKDRENEIQKYGDTSGLKTLTQERDELIRKITQTEDALAKEKAELDECEQRKKKLFDALQRDNGDGAFRKAMAQYALVENLFKIFERGKAEYRDKLKERVQEDASSIFVRLSSDKDYTSLKINERYGLTIVHKSGDLVKWRSSGYEHIVALSLIAALHKNAPLRGPIIMDSPFGRLDPGHTSNVVSVLPSMEEQTLLFAYEGEIDAATAKEALGTSLVKEYRLTKHSSFYTSIDE